jgi:hypothetical protein
MLDGEARGVQSRGVGFPQGFDSVIPFALKISKRGCMDSFAIHPYNLALALVHSREYTQQI